MVNRYWQKLVGRGLVEPVDEMDNRPWNEDLLDWLASDFTAHRYDLKHLLRQIMTSAIRNGTSKRRRRQVPIAGVPLAEPRAVADDRAPDGQGVAGSTFGTSAGGPWPTSRAGRLSSRCS